MDRSTRKTTHLTKKLERKLARSRGMGSKAKRWKRAIDKYKPPMAEAVG